MKIISMKCQQNVINISLDNYNKSFKMTLRKIAVLYIQEMRKSVIKTIDGQNILNNPDAIGCDLDNFVRATRYTGNKTMSSIESEQINKFVIILGILLSQNIFV